MLARLARQSTVRYGTLPLEAISFLRRRSPLALTSMGAVELVRSYASLRQPGNGSCARKGQLRLLQLHGSAGESRTHLSP